jgi:ubiquinone/menaquinone biosynthesis C-methylase UbiE
MVFDPRKDYQNSQTAQHYDEERFSCLSGRIFQWAERQSLGRVIRRMTPGSLIIDAPCGTGRLTGLFLQHGFKAIGADISQEMIDVARHRTAWGDGKVSFARMDFVSVPLSDASVSAIFSFRFLPHIDSEERIRILREFCRVSQRWVIISLSLSTPWHRVRRIIKELLGLPKPVRHPVTNSALAEELARAGLIEVERFWTFPILSEQVVVVCEKAGP